MLILVFPLPPYVVELDVPPDPEAVNVPDEVEQPEIYVSCPELPWQIEAPLIVGYAVHCPHTLTPTIHNPATTSNSLSFLTERKQTKLFT